LRTLLFDLNTGIQRMESVQLTSVDNLLGR
jgi:hypothetical protein